MPCQLYSDGNFPGIHCPRSHKKWSNFKAHKNVRNGETKLPGFFLAISRTFCQIWGNSSYLVSPFLTFCVLYCGNYLLVGLSIFCL